MNNEPNVVVVGATGAVGREILSILEERQFPFEKLELVASSRSKGKKLGAFGSDFEVEALSAFDFSDTDLVLSSAGSSVSREFAPKAIEQGAVIVDNTSAFRMEEEVPLVVPEFNSEDIENHSGIIANPNCSTIQMVVALQPLEQINSLERVIVNTYQSASGAGQAGIEELEAGIEARQQGESFEPETFSSELAYDVLPHIGRFFENGYTKEEMKMTRETRKIMNRPSLPVSATCVRVPVERAHSEALTVDLAEPVQLDRIRRTFENAAGIRMLDDPDELQYPSARNAEHTDAVWVGRLRKDVDRDRTLHFWNVSDNLRKGAALNTVQIAERLIDTNAE